MGVKHYPNVCQSKYSQLIIYRLLETYGSEQVFFLLCVCWKSSPTGAEFRRLLPCWIVIQSIGFSVVFRFVAGETKLSQWSKFSPALRVVPSGR